MKMNKVNGVRSAKAPVRAARAQAMRSSVPRSSAPAPANRFVCQSVAVAEAPVATAAETPNPSDLNQRHAAVNNFFPGVLGVDDFIQRVEIALCGYGFTGRNSIACSNLCRDEITAVLKDKIEHSFGGSFNTNGLGGVLTCGVTGIGAGLSHSPICESSGRERYVFFSFPHIAIDSNGALANISRPGRPGTSCACGALIKCMGELKADGVEKSCKVPGVHDPLDPEYSILKQRLARRIRWEQQDIQNMDLADITKAAERMITDDLEYLIEKAVDTNKADYAVVTGVQIHNWSTNFDDSVPNLELVWPTKVYVVTNGKATYLDLTKIPSLTPRQLQLLAQASMGSAAEPSTSNIASGVSATSTITEIPHDYMAHRLGAADVKGASVIQGDKPAYSDNIKSTSSPTKDPAKPKMDSIDLNDMTQAFRSFSAAFSNPSFVDTFSGKK